VRRPAAYLVQSPPERLVVPTVVLAGMPSTPASMAGGTSLVSWSSAASQAHALRLNAKLAHSVSQCDGSEGLAGALAGEQPGRGQLLDDAASASQGQGLDEGGEGLGEFEPFGPQLQAHGVAVALDVLGGERDDAAQGLGVEDDQCCCDPVGGIEGVVGDQAAGDAPALFGVGPRCGRPR